jgi:hypothetical protein
LANWLTWEASHALSDATVGGGSTPDLTWLILDGKKSSSGNGLSPSTYRRGRKCAADAQPIEFAVRTLIYWGSLKRAKVVGYEIAGDLYTDDSASDGWSVQANSRCRSTRQRQSGTYMSPFYYKGVIEI